jgi:hypothetical protein
LPSGFAADFPVNLLAVTDIEHPGVVGLNSRKPPLDQGCHLPTVKVGVQKLSGHMKIEMKYCTQLWNSDTLPAEVGKCGELVLTKTPTTM